MCLYTVLVTKVCLVFVSSYAISCGIMLGFIVHNYNTVLVESVLYNLMTLGPVFILSTSNIC